MHQASMSQKFQQQPQLQQQIQVQRAQLQQPQKRKNLKISRGLCWLKSGKETMFIKLKTR